MNEPPAPILTAGQRVRLTAEFVEHSSNPERQVNYRGVIQHETSPLGPEYVLVRWDGIERLYPVLKNYLQPEVDHE